MAARGMVATMAARDVVDLRQRARDGYSIAHLADRFGIDPRYVKPLATGALRSDVPIQLPPWTPLCMSPKDYRLWKSDKEAAGHVPRPCGDCPLSFAKEMSVLGLCNGEPELDGSELLGDWRTAA